MIRSKPSTDAYREAWERVFGEPDDSAKPSGMVSEETSEHGVSRESSRPVTLTGMKHPGDSP